MAAKSIVFDLLARDRASKAISDVGKSFDDAEKKSRRLSTGFAALGKTVGTAFAAFAVGDFLKDSVQGLQDHQKVVAQTAAAIKSTGGAAKASVAQVSALSDALEAKTTVDGDVIQSGANMLLTFTNIRNEAGKGKDIFNQATKTLVDMSVATGTDASKAAITLGKALNDPIKGVGALSRVGVTFDDQQKKQIATMVKAGDTAGAQAIILKELNKEFGGSAAASATMSGRFMVAFHALQDAVGGVLLPLGNAVLPLITKGLQKVGDFMQGPFTSGLQAFKSGVAGVDQSSRGFIGRLNDLGLGIRALITAYQDNETTSNGFVGVLEHIGVAARKVVDFFTGTVIPGVKALVGAFKDGDVTSGGFIGVMERIGVAARAVAGWFTGTALPALQRFGGFIRSTVLPAIGQFVQWIGPIIGRALAAFGHWVMGTAVPALQRFGGFVRDTVIPAAERLGGFLAKNLGPTFVALGNFITGRVWPALQGLWARFQQVLPTILRVGAFVAKIIGIFAALVVIILGKVLPIIIRLAGPIFTLLFAAIGKIIGIAAALGRAFVAATKVVINVFLNMVGVILNGAAKAFGWVPGLGGKLKGAAAEFNKFRDRVNGALAGVKSRGVTVTAQLVASQRAVAGVGTSGSGGRNNRLATGGPVRGPGSTTSDSIPAMLSNNEHVWSAREVAGAGGHDSVAMMRKMAAAGKLPGFAAGGPVRFDVTPRLAGMPQFQAGIAAYNARTDAAARALGVRAFGQMLASSAPGVPTSVSANAALGRQLAAQLYGWTGGQWAALYALWQRESGWRNTAQNPTSTAYGIPQFLNSTWGSVGFSKTSDARTQILAGLRYILGRYGSPAAAWAHETSAGWYRNGLDYVPKDNFPAMLHRGERVLTAAENRGYGGGLTIIVNIDGVPATETAFIQKTRHAIREALRAEGKAAAAANI